MIFRIMFLNGGVRMSKKNIIFSVCTIAIVAALVYVVGMFIISSVAHHGNSNNDKSSNTVSLSKDDTVDTKDNKESVSDEIVKVDDAFEYFRDKSFNDVIIYSNEFTRRQITIDKNDVLFVGVKDVKVDFTAPVELNDESVIAVDFKNESDGIFFVQEDASAGNIYYSVYMTNDGGAKWEEKNVTHFAGEISGVYYTDADKIVVISAGGAYATNVINVSENGAGSWKVVENEITDNENGIIYPIRITEQEKVFLIACMDNETVSSAMMYKLDNDWSVEDSYEVRVK